MPTPNLPRRGSPGGGGKKLYKTPARRRSIASQNSNWRARPAGARAVEAASGSEVKKVARSEVAGVAGRTREEVANLCKQLEAICANPAHGYLEGPVVAKEIKKFRTYVETML
ncbi:hypothetical protein EYR40_007042 [Pleurotus pulmonarius]|nr:hypothetical protein EYR38_007092 [Pleurotus pulmonarius]KAF4599936.1 hypothetical protein EYR40_007042 [Pleurotus pulmonarius]